MSFSRVLSLNIFLAVLHSFYFMDIMLSCTPLYDTVVTISRSVAFTCMLNRRFRPVLVPIIVSKNCTAGRGLRCNL